MDLIYEYRTDGKTQVSDAIICTLCNLAEEGQIVYEDGWGYFFRTQKMDQLLPVLDEPISSWGNSGVYWYWLDIQEHNRLRGVFEFGGMNVPKESMSKMQEIIDTLKPNDKRKEDFTYKRIYTTKWYDISDTEDIAVTVEKVVRLAVKDILDMEAQVLAQ